MDLKYDKLQLNDVPFILPALQKQQSSLMYMCEFKNLPGDSTFKPAIDELFRSACFIETELVASEESLSRLNTYLEQSGMPSWIDDDAVQSYFELQTMGDSAGYQDVELVASKTYALGMVMIIIYFEGNYSMEDTRSRPS